DANHVTAERLALHRDLVITLARLASARTADGVPSGSAQFIIEEAVVALPLGDVIDIAKERTRLEKEVAKAASEVGRIDAKRANEASVPKAPEEAMDEKRERRAKAAALRDRLSDALKRLSV